MVQNSSTAMWPDPEKSAEALPLIDALFCEVNPIPVKAALNLMGKEVGRFVCR